MFYLQGKKMAIHISLGIGRKNWEKDVLVEVRFSCIFQKAQIKWLKQMRPFSFL